MSDFYYGVQDATVGGTGLHAEGSVLFAYKREMAAIACQPLKSSITEHVRSDQDVLNDGASCFETNLSLGPSSYLHGMLHLTALQLKQKVLKQSARKSVSCSSHFHALHAHHIFMLCPCESLPKLCFDRPIKAGADLWNLIEQVCILLRLGFFQDRKSFYHLNNIAWTLLYCSK